MVHLTKQCGLLQCKRQSRTANQKSGSNGYVFHNNMSVQSTVTAAKFPSLNPTNLLSQSICHYVSSQFSMIIAVQLSHTTGKLLTAVSIKSRHRNFAQMPWRAFGDRKATVGDMVLPSAAQCHGQRATPMSNWLHWVWRQNVLGMILC
jgi:hypothetical protein